ncbi:MAG: GntR family transcriptional regulator [Candidatus Humimicrobiaceae bacterium]
MDLKINQKNLSFEAYNKIKLMILNDVLKSGEKIYQEKMAEKLGISKIPLIQALSILQKERLLKYIPGKGFFVRKISTPEFHDLLDLRGALEGLAVKKIALIINEDIKKELFSFLSDFEKYYQENDLIKYAELDKKFHFYIFETSKNSYLPHINDSFNILILVYTKGFRTDLAESIKDHRNIINAIIEGKGKKAATLMEKHSDKVKKYF